MCYVEVETETLLDLGELNGLFGRPFSWTLQSETHNLKFKVELHSRKNDVESQ